MRICLIAPFFTGSHQRWAEGFRKSSRHDVSLLNLPGRYWKWRMHGGAITLAQQFLAQAQMPDIILTTDMLDVATFAALIRHQAAHIPIVVYFHENQLTYPWSPTDEDVKLQRDRHYSWINYTSSLTADRVLFNSKYHRNSFLEALPIFLKAYPDHQEVGMVEEIRKKSEVMHLGMDLAEMKKPAGFTKTTTAPTLLWNHRWEYDKNPEGFFQLCYQLQDLGLNFQLIVLGEQYRHSPPIFAEAQEKLANHILHWGYAKNKAEYLHWLWQADILPVTGFQDFLGGSVVEAMFCDTYPLLPNRLAYPEHIPVDAKSVHLYQDEADLLEKLKKILSDQSFESSSIFQSWVEHYDWATIIEAYDLFFEKMMK